MPPPCPGGPWRCAFALCLPWPAPPLVRVGGGSRRAEPASRRRGAALAVVAPVRAPRVPAPPARRPTGDVRSRRGGSMREKCRCPLPDPSVGAANRRRCSQRGLRRLAVRVASLGDGVPSRRSAERVALPRGPRARCGGSPSRPDGAVLGVPGAWRRSEQMVSGKGGKDGVSGPARGLAEALGGRPPRLSPSPRRGWGTAGGRRRGRSLGPRRSGGR